MPVRGGERLKRHIAQQRRKAQTAPKVTSVGFHDATGPLAKRLEFGSPTDRLPERPAFRRALSAAAKAHSAVLEQAGELTHEAAARAGKASEQEIRSSYLNFRGPGLSKVQEERKRGTAGAGKELIGHRGPKLIEHIETFVDGLKVP